MAWRELGLGASVALAVLALGGCGGEPEAATAPSACAAFHFSDRGGVRVFVVGHRQSLADDASYATFAASYARHMDAIAPCLSKSRPNLVVFPEDAALGALLVGSRGAAARKAASSTAAFIEILKAYDAPFQHVKAQYPKLSLKRQLLLTLTDVTWRAFDRAFGGIAKDHGVWVLANANVAPHTETTDPQLVSALGDPEADDPSRAYVPSEPNVYNSAYLFDPSGSVAGRVDKVFLVDSEEQSLDLSNGSFSDLAVLDAPFGRIGVATSRDAFYAPFMQRLEDLDVKLVVQPEAFSGWTIEEQPGDWLPDVFLASGWLHTQKYRSFSHSLNSVLTGNFFELVFDGQAHVTERARPGHGLGRYVGQEPIPGFGSVGPWVEPDPGIADASLTLDARRSALRDVGKALLPGSGAPNEDGYVDSLVAQDLELEAKATKLARDSKQPESRALSASSGAAQRNVDLTHDAAGKVLAAWQDQRSGSWRIRVATSADGGASFADAGEVDAGTSPQKKPAVCSDGTRVAIAWQEGEAAERVRVALAPTLGAPFAPPLDVAPGEPGAQWEPDCGFLANGDLVVAWTGFPNGVPKVRVAKRAAGAGAFDAPIAADASTDAKPRLDGSELQPALSETGGELVWLDYRERSWDVYAARFDGTALTPAKRVDGVTDPRERLHGEPRVEVAKGRVIVAWSDLAERRGHADIGFALSDDGGDTWSERRLVPGGPATTPPRSSGGQSMPRYRPAIAVGASGVRLVFQDLSPDKSAIFASTLDAAGNAGEASRADDTGASALSLTRPRATALGAGTLVAWEDDRDGAPQIYFSLLP